MPRFTRCVPGRGAQGDPRARSAGSGVGTPQPPGPGLLAASLSGCGLPACFGLGTFGIFRPLVGFQSRHFWLPPRLPSPSFFRSHMFFLWLLSLTDILSLPLALTLPLPATPPPLASPLPPRKEKLQTRTNKTSAIPCAGELRQEPSISGKTRQRELKASVVSSGRRPLKSPRSVYAGTLPASLWLAAASPRDERPAGSFRAEEKPAQSPRPGPARPPLLPSPGGVEGLFQTSVPRDISDSLITSRDRRGGCLSAWAPAGASQQSLRCRR